LIIALSQISNVTFSAVSDQRNEDAKCSPSDEMNEQNFGVMAKSSPAFLGERIDRTKNSSSHEQAGITSMRDNAQILVGENDHAHVLTEKSDKKITKLQQMLASASSFTSSFVSEVLKANEQSRVTMTDNFSSELKDQTVPQQMVQSSSAEVSDGPSQRAASLLLSRLSAVELQSTNQAFIPKANMQHWNGSGLCDDPYASTIYCAF
jgi:hypothetical protein